MADGSVTIVVDADESEAKKKLEGVESAAEDAGEGLEKMGDSAEGAEGGLDALDIAAGNLVANGISALVGKLGELVGELFSLAEETREYRDDMAKLDTAFSTAGHTTDTANAAYKSFYAILGESDRSVEAVNHLAALTKSEEDLAQWSTIAAGVTARFGDSLPIEGLTEAANETAKVGAVTGPLADALNWAGISEDEFNAKLAQCNSEQERASLITSTLNKEYSAAAAEYNELTKSTQDARLATAEMEEAQAALGEAIEPITTKFTELKTMGLQWLVDTGLPALQNGWQWVLNNIPTIVGLVATLTAAWLTFGGAQKIVDGWNKLMAISQAALNAVMNANPIGLIITAIALLVTAFITLWNNCEGFRNFFIGLWETIKNAVSVAVEAIAGFFTGLWNGIVEVWNTVAGWFNDNVIQPIVGFFQGLWESIVNAYHTVIDPWIEIVKRIASIIYDNVIKPVTDFFVNLWNGIKEGASAAWDGIVNIWNIVSGWFNDNIIRPVADFFSNMWNGLKDGASNAWNGIKSIFSKVASFFGDIFGKAWEKVKAVFSVGGKIFDGIKDGIVTAFKTVVNGIIRGINKIVALPFKGLNGILDTIQAVDIVGIQPFSWLTWRAPIPQIPELAKGGVLKRGQIGLLEGNGAEAVVPLEKNTEWLDEIAKRLNEKMSGLKSNLVTQLRATVNIENARFSNIAGTPDNGFTDLARAVGIQTAGINSLANEYRGGTGRMRPIILQLDGRELGRAVVDVGSAETVRVGTKLVGGTL